MDRYTYNCNYCGAEYKPRRRHKQKYCSNSCRVNAFTQRKKTRLGLSKPKTEELLRPKEKMSWSGIGNAAAGTLATNLVTNILTKEENKPATKGDIQKLLDGHQAQFVFIKNVPPRSDGKRAYFDTYKQILIYK